MGWIDQQRRRHEWSLHGPVFRALGSQLRKIECRKDGLICVGNKPHEEEEETSSVSKILETNLPSLNASTAPILAATTAKSSTDGTAKAQPSGDTQTSIVEDGKRREGSMVDGVRNHTDDSATKSRQTERIT